MSPLWKLAFLNAILAVATAVRGAHEFAAWMSAFAAVVGTLATFQDVTAERKPR